MHRKTVIGLLVGTAVLATGGIAIAASRQAHGPASNRPYVEYPVQKGDTLSALGLRFFGDAKAWPALLEGQAKPFSMVDILPVGTILRIPCSWAVVKKGDTLAKIAAETLQDAGRWRRIFEANRNVLSDPDRLEIGKTLAIPVLPVARTQPAATSTQVPTSFGLDFLGAF
jgi:nucleoid-associated protein YgaU